MIKTKTKTEEEKEYRRQRKDSSSSLKMFSQDRKKYYKKYFLDEAVEEEENKAANIGRLVETLAFEAEEFDNRFAMSTSEKAPSGLMAEFINAFYSATINNVDEMGEPNKTFLENAKEAYLSAGYKITFEKVLENFLKDDKSGFNPEAYFKEMLEIRTRGLTIVTLQDVQNAEKIVKELFNNSVTSEIMNTVSNDRYEVINQFQINNYEVLGLPMKSMLDKIIIDNKEKKISIYDLKCTWSVEGFYKDYYLYRRAYIQALVYFHAVKSLTKDKGSAFYNYIVEYPQFIVVDSINYMNPLIYTLNDTDMKEAVDGFTVNNKYYPGVADIVEDLLFAKNHNIWNISRKHYEAGGIINIKD